MNRTFVRLVGAAALTTACASTSPPQQRLDAVRGELAAAEAVEAHRYPNSALHLQLAREQVEKARALMRAGKNERADFMLRRAQADAELAIALTKNAPILQKCEEAKQALAKVKG